MGGIVAASAGRMTYKADLLQLTAKLLPPAANAENVPLRAVRLQTRPVK